MSLRSPRSLRSHGAAQPFILVTAMLDILAMGLVIPVLPGLIQQFTGSNASAGVWNGIFVALWAGTQFIASPIIGSLSDRFGRRPVILVSVAGMAADWALMAVAPNLWWLAVGRIIGGATSSSFTTVFAYTSDITPPEKRARAFGLIGAAFSLGFVIGPALGGVLGEVSLRAPFWAAAALSSLAFVYGWLILPESLSADKRMAFSWKRANPFGSLQLLRSHHDLLKFAGVYFLLHFSHHVFSVVFVLYSAKRYGWSALDVGLLLAFVGVLDMFVQGVLTGPVVKRLGDRLTLAVGLVAGVVGLMSMGLAPTWWFVAAMLPNCLWGLAMPTIQSLMTARVSESEQGQLQGANNSIGSLAGVFSPLFFGAVYAATAGGFIGASFLIAALILLVAAAIAFAGSSPQPQVSSSSSS